MPRCRPLALALAHARQVILPLAMVGTLLPWTFNPSSVRAQQETFPIEPVGPVYVEPEPPPEPAARIQVVIRTIDVSNDRDGFWTGEGDILLMAGVWRCSGPQPPCSASDNNPARLLAYARKSFNAESGETENLNRLVPLAVDVRDSAFASEEAGIEVYPGQDYLLEFNAFERDFSGGDFMGGVQRVLRESNNWGIGHYTREPAGEFADTSLPPTEDSLLCAGCGGIIVGDYLVTYEIRRAPLPDLHPKTLRVIDSAGSSEDVVCVETENVGQQEAPSFQMTLRVDGAVARNGTSDVLGLAASQSRETCIRTDLPTSGRHQLSLTVDDGRALPEMNERNNEITRGLDRTPLGSVGIQDGPGLAIADPGTDSGQPPSPGGDGIARPAGQRLPDIATTPGVVKPPGPDLSISSVDVKARDGGPCVIRGMRNLVTVVVHSSADGGVGEFAVEVKVGNDRRGRVTVGGMSSNTDRAVLITDVGVDQGEHNLQVIIDPDNKVTEDNEQNNTRTVQVDCTSRG